MLAGNLDHEIGVQEVFRPMPLSTFSELELQDGAAVRARRSILSRLRHIAT